MLLQKVKLALRISAPVYDDEINDLIESAKLDLSSTGIKVDEQNALIQRAIIIYCKANFGLENPDFVRYTNAYENLKSKLKLAGEFNGS